MKLEIRLVFLMLVLLQGSSQTKGQSSALPPVFPPAALPSHADTSASPDLTEDPGNEVLETHNPAGRDETSTETTTIIRTKGAVHSETVTDAVFKTHLVSTSSAGTTSQHMDEALVLTAQPGTANTPGSLSSTPTLHSSTPPPPRASTTDSRTPLTQDPPSTFSSSPAECAHTVQDTSSTARASTTKSHSESWTTDHPVTSAPIPAGPTHQEVPSELNVGDEDFKGPRHRSSSPLDPLLAGLLSVFIVTTAIVFIALFLRFRQRTNHPEFHRLQDLPMDDLMEDTPLSRYSY
ncbi:uncharacterized protein LOC131472582 [Solea solea]|uniref:uncharacterized protein LOC131472582 n=1 Tax=Solea solea TaxID=90069 RepID=UPI00272A19B7|nr:uncharacterized protein LOC131472582 [Solea solea]